MSNLCDRRNICEVLTLHKIVRGTIESNLTEKNNIRCNTRTMNSDIFSVKLELIWVYMNRCTGSVTLTTRKYTTLMSGLQE